MRGYTITHPVPIFSPERWQSIGSSAPLTPPQERTVSRRRRETTKYASALNARMIFGTAATTATQKFRRPDSKSFCRFHDAAVPRDRQTDSQRNSRSVHLYKLHFVSFVVRSATLKKPRNGGNFRDRMWECRTAHAHSDIPHLVRAAPRHPRHRAKCTLKNHCALLANLRSLLP